MNCNMHDLTGIFLGIIITGGIKMNKKLFKTAIK